MTVASFNYIGLHKSHSSMSEDGRFVVRIANQMHTYVRTGTAIIVYALLNSRKCVAICPNGTEQNGTKWNEMETGMRSIKWRFCIK